MLKKIIIVIFLMFSVNSCAFLPFGVKDCDTISYHTPCWGENNKVYFIKVVMHWIYDPHPLIPIMGNHYFIKYEYYLCSMNYDGSNKKEITEIMKESKLEDLKKRYKKEFWKEWEEFAPKPYPRIFYKMSYCKITNKLVYNRRWGMWSINADGTDEKFLDYYGIRPAWSPDGKKIAYQSKDNSIWIMNQDGSNKKLISIKVPVKVEDEKKDIIEVMRFNDEYPLWSPNGNLIVFICNSSIWIMKPDGSERKKIIDWPYLGGWLFDGTKIFGGCNDRRGIIDLNGNIVKDVKREGLLSLDGKMVIDEETFNVFKIPETSTIRLPSNYTIIDLLDELDAQGSSTNALRSEFFEKQDEEEKWTPLANLPSQESDWEKGKFFKYKRNIW